MTGPAARPLAGRRALVTGASRGIGAAVVRALAEAGASVAAVARSADQLRAVLAPIGSTHRAIAADLTTEDGIANVLHSVVAWGGGPPDIIVNCAGTFPRATVEAQAPAGFASTVALNLEAPFRVVHGFLGAMRARGSGDIVTIGSVADRQAFAENAAYGASKYGLRALHEVVRTETRGSGVRAILVSPGPVDTEIWAPHEPLLGTRLPARAAMLLADDVARAVCFAVSQPAHVDVEELRLARS